MQRVVGNFFGKKGKRRLTPNIKSFISNFTLFCLTARYINIADAELHFYLPDGTLYR